MYWTEDRVHQTVRWVVHWLAIEARPHCVSHDLVFDDDRYVAMNSHILYTKRIKVVSHCSRTYLLIFTYYNTYSMPPAPL